MGNDPLLFWKWIFRNSQPIRDDDCRIFVSGTAHFNQKIGKHLSSSKFLHPENLPVAVSKF
jgi:hypothetical protein